MCFDYETQGFHYFRRRHCPELKASDRDDWRDQSEARSTSLATAKPGAAMQRRSARSKPSAAVIKREQNGSTGFGKGVAVPHVKHPAVKQMSGTIGRSAGGLDFAALDHQPVH